MSGARAVQKSILEGFPKADISVSVIWIDMLPSDNADAAKKIAKTIKDPRVRHFHDPRENHLAGKAFANGLIREGAGPAWDIYLFYEKGTSWDEKTPRPFAWWHQLGGGKRADPEHFAAGMLGEKLKDSMEKLTGQGETKP